MSTPDPAQNPEQNADAERIDSAPRAAADPWMWSGLPTLAGSP